MSLYKKSISPAVLAAVLLSACGGGGGTGDNGKTASSSPKASVTTPSSAHTGADKASAHSKATGSTTGTGNATEAVAQKLAVQTHVRKAAFFEPRKLRGDALSTMLDATTPIDVTSSSQTRDVFDDHGNVIDTIYEEKWSHFPVIFRPLAGC